jgi:hypothetical protein
MVWRETKVGAISEQAHRKGKHIAAFACLSGSGAEKAFGKLKAALGIDSLEAELILIDPKEKPDHANEKKIEAFCAKMK